MKKSLFLIFTVGTLMSLQGILCAQDKVQWTESGSYMFSGGVSLGYRNVGIGTITPGMEDYATRRYYEAFNFRSGVTLSDINLFGEKKQGQKGFFDELYLNGSGVNEPYTNLGLRLRTFNSYDFRVSFRKAQYYCDRPDSLWSDSHKFDMARQMLSASLAVDLAPMANIELYYNGNGRSGNEVITNSTYFYGVVGADYKENNGTAAGTSNYASLGTNNYYWMNTPRNDQTNDFGARLNLKFKEANTNILIGGGYRVFNQDITYTPYSLQSLTFLNNASGIGTPGASFSANANGLVGYNIRNEALRTYSWKDTRDSKTPYFLVQAVSKIMPWFSVTADARYESTDGTSDNHGYEDGLMRKVTSWYDSVAKKLVYGVLVKDSTLLQNYYGKTDGTADSKFTRMMGSVLMSFDVNKHIKITARVKYSSDEQTSSSSSILGTSRDTTMAYNFTSFHYDTIRTNIKYTNKIMTMSPQVVYSPMSNLTLRAGLTILQRTPLYNIDTIMNAIVPKELYNLNMSKSVTSTCPVISVYYKPMPELAVRVRYEMMDNKSTYDASTLSPATKALSPNLGTTFAGTAPQFDMITPDVRTVINAGLDLFPMKELTFSATLRMETGKGDILPWYDYYNFYNNVYTDTTKTKVTVALPVTGDLTLKTNVTGITASALYTLDSHTSIRAGFQYSQNKWSIPFSGLSSNVDTSGGKVAPFGELRTGLIDQDIKNTSVDFAFSTQLMDKLNFNLSGMMLNSTGGGLIDPNSVSPSKTNGVPSGSKDPKAPITSFGVTNPRLNNPWVGGPYSSLTICSGLQYMFSSNIGLGLDVQYSTFEESLEASYVALGQFKATMIKGSVLVRL